MRLKNTLRNLIWNLISQFFLILTGLLIKRVLLVNIGTEKIGLNYLFNDIVGLLSIAELGLTGIIAYYLYEPLARGNELQVIKIMGFFRKAYFVIGSAVLLIGLFISPFLGLFLGDTTIDDRYIYFAFLLFLIRNSEGYFLSYKSILPFADQKNYLVLVIDIISTFIYTVISVVIILLTKNFLYILFLEIIKKIISDLIMIQVVNRKYPYMKGRPKETLEKVEILRIGRDIRNAFVSKVSKAVISTTDNIIMSVYLGLSMIGLFSNYTLVLYTVQTLLLQLVSSAQASIGHLIVTEKEKVVTSVVNKMTFISFFIVSFCGCGLYRLTTPFVALFFGEEYVLGQVVVLVSIFNIYLDIMQRTMIQVSEAGGLFRQTKKINLISCSLNVLLSLIGVRFLGITGILLGTFLSRVIEVVLRIKVSFNEILKTAYRYYIRNMILYTAIFALEMFLGYTISNLISIVNPILEFILYGIIAGAVPLGINIVIFYHTDNFKYMLQLIRILLLKMNTKPVKTLDE